MSYYVLQGENEHFYRMHASWEYVCVPARVLRVCTASLTVCALHLCIIASFDEADVSQVEDSCNNLEHLSLDVTWDSNHVHGFLETAGRDVLSGLVTGCFTQSQFFHI